MDRVGIEPNGLTHVVVVRSEGILHVRKSCRVVDSRSPVRSIPCARSALYKSKKRILQMGYSQPGVHQVRASSAQVIEESIHRDLPKAGEDGLPFTYVRHRQTVICHAIVKRVRPESVGAIRGDGNGRSRRRIVCEFGSGKQLKSLARVIEERRTETLYRFERNTGQGIESNQVTIDLVGRGCADVGHSVS